jgi:epoxyqueuosine reductase
MTVNKFAFSTQIINKAIEFGASLAGIMNVGELKKSPSHVISSKIPDFKGIGTKNAQGKKRGEVQWPDSAKSGVVIAVKHLTEKPELDWWEKGLKGGTKGNFKLITIFSKLADWIHKNSHIHCIKTPYHIEHGGVYMKDAAVLAGIGCIGKNNMLVTPKFGPRVRLRVMLLDIDFPSTGILNFHPCIKCNEHCKKICPQNAFDKKKYSEDEFKLKDLPSRTGWYDRFQCNVQMEKDNIDSISIVKKNHNNNIQIVKYCRQCEIACPIG